MNLRKFVVFFIVFSLLSYYYFHHELSNRNAENQKEEQERKVFARGSDEDITSISLEYDGKEFILQKEAEADWFLIKPVQDKADTFIANNIVSTIRMGQRVRTLDNTDFDFSAIGLLPPSMRIGIRFGEKRRFLLLGDETYVGANRYARWEDSDEVFLVDKRFYDVFKKDLYTLRNKNIFSFNANNIDELHVALSEESIILKRIDDDKKNEWWVMKPFENRASETVLNGYLRDVSRIMANSFYDDKKVDDAELGFSIDKNYIYVKDTNGDDTLFIGARTSDNKNNYAYLKSKEKVLAIAADIVDSLKKDSDEFIDKRIYPFRTDQITHIAYYKGERKVVFNKVDALWRSVQETNEGENVKEDTIKFDNDCEDLLRFYAELTYESILNQETIHSLELSTDDILFQIECIPETNDEEAIIFSLYAKQDSYIVKENKDPNFFLITPEKYHELNTLLKNIL
ncbi:MAG: DUF4340 domain-containing protein [Candidatus Omnitrophica bacterium]|nr:DUF4340 domain-containing protein [Candidatus Omnitrophota bacterium]